MKQKIETAEELLTAYHEAGHVVIPVYFNDWARPPRHRIADGIVSIERHDDYARGIVTDGRAGMFLPSKFRIKASRAADLHIGLVGITVAVPVVAGGTCAVAHRADEALTILLGWHLIRPQ
jgi:hypothetical protein